MLKFVGVDTNFFGNGIDVLQFCCLGDFEIGGDEGGEHILGSGFCKGIWFLWC